MFLIFSICLHNQLKLHNSRALGIHRTPGRRETPGSPDNFVPHGIPGRLGFLESPWSLWVSRPFGGVSILQLEFHYKGFHVKFKVGKFLFKYRRKVVTNLGTPDTLRNMELPWIELPLGCLKLFDKNSEIIKTFVMCRADIHVSSFETSLLQSPISFWVVFRKKGIFCEKKLPKRNTWPMLAFKF